MYETIARIVSCVPLAVRTAGLAIVLTAVGCSSGGRGSGSPFRSQAESRISVEVINTGFTDATLHAFWPGKRVRLGTVTGTRTSTFRLPWEASQVIQFEISLLAGSECFTREMWADPGDIIVLEITNQIMRDPDCLRGRPRD